MLERNSICENVCKMIPRVFLDFFLVSEAINICGPGNVRYPGTCT